MLRRPLLFVSTILSMVLCAGNLHAKTLETILKSKILRVGTTGDYPPFSSEIEDGKYEGLDIEMAKSLAESLGVKIVFVKTTWPNLLPELVRGKYDIGMSGISISLSRQKKALFSTPYLKGGKSAIARCRDSKKFDSLQKIDRKNNRVIVNPGGTNEQFVRANIKKAEIKIFHDNLKIFDEIIGNRADVMITDSVETIIQARKHKGTLCALRTERPFTFGQFGYLLPQDPLWKAYVDQWLNISVGSGFFGKLKTSWIGR